MTLRDRQCAGDPRHVREIVGLIDAVTVLNHVAAHDVRAAAGIRLAANRCRFDREPSRQTCSSYACLGQGSAVIGLDGGLRGQGDFRCVIVSIGCC